MRCYAELILCKILYLFRFKNKPDNKPGFRYINNQDGYVVNQLMVLGMYFNTTKPQFAVALPNRLTVN